MGGSGVEPKARRSRMERGGGGNRGRGKSGQPEAVGVGQQTMGDNRQLGG